MPTNPHNLSTDHQPEGSATKPSDTLDRPADSADYQQVDAPEKTPEDYRRELGSKPDSATVSHAPPPADANPNA